MRELKTDYESKITNLESTIAAKDIHIKQLVLITYYGVAQETTACPRRPLSFVHPFKMKPIA